MGDFCYFFRDTGYVVYNNIVLNSVKKLEYHNKINSQNIDFDYLTKEFIPLLKEFQIPMIITTKNSDGSVEYQDLEIQFSEKILKIAGIDSNFNIDNITS